MQERHASKLHARQPKMVLLAGNGPALHTSQEKVGLGVANRVSGCWAGQSFSAALQVGLGGRSTVLGWSLGSVGRLEVVAVAVAVVAVAVAVVVVVVLLLKGILF